MSDNAENKFLSGNFAGRSHSERRGDENIFSYPRRTLVEECESISMSDIRNRFKRKELLGLAERERAFRIRHENRHYEITLCAERYQQSWRSSGTSDIARVWLLCGCGRRVRRLYLHHRDSDSGAKCRACQQLRYLSQNSGKTKWFHRIVKPLRRLIRRQDKLFLRKRTKRVVEEINFIEGQIFILTQRARPKGSGRRFSGVRRRYRNVSLIIGNR